MGDEWVKWVGAMGGEVVVGLQVDGGLREGVGKVEGWVRGESGLLGRAWKGRGDLRMPLMMKIQEK